MYKTYFTTLNQTVNKPLKNNEFNALPVFRFRKRIRIHRIHIALQDPDPAYYSEACNWIRLRIRQKDSQNTKNHGIEKVLSNKNSVKKENDKNNRIRIRIH
jgi:hypothetical protein